jgi:hypothetical protein
MGAFNDAVRAMAGQCGCDYYGWPIVRCAKHDAELRKLPLTKEGESEVRSGRPPAETGKAIP